MQRCTGLLSQCKTEMPPPELEADAQPTDVIRWECPRPGCARLYVWKHADPEVHGSRGKWTHVPRIGEGDAASQRGMTMPSKNVYAPGTMDHLKG